MSLTLNQSFTAVVAATALLGAVAAGSAALSSRAAGRAQEAASNRYQSFLLADELRQSSDDLTRLARTFVVSNGEAKWEKQYFDILDIRNGKQPRPQAYERIYWDFKAAGADSVRPEGDKLALLEMMKAAGFTAGELAKLEEAKANSDGLVRTETMAMNLAKGLKEDGSPGDPTTLEDRRSKARAMMHDLAYHQNKAKIMKPVDEFFVLLDERTASTLASATADQRMWMLASQLALAGLLLSVVVAVVGLQRRTSRVLREVHSVATGIADGDVSQRIEASAGGDEGQLMSTLANMQSRLSGIISSIRSGSESVAAASAQIAHGNHDLSQRTEEQASALQVTAATMEQLGATVRNNADSANQANQLAQGASAVAAQGGEVVGKVVVTMQGINDSSRKIGDIISVIDGIAFQTNILALNAAVEAARAGEQGRGFAVVASEVRSLAQRSAEAAKEIKTLIGRSVEQVEQGTVLVDQAGKTMGEIVGSIQRVSDMVAEITSASAEQSSGVQQVGLAVTQMDHSTQQNAALVEESSAAADSLRQQAQQLVQAVAVFKLAGGGTGHAAPSSATASHRPAHAMARSAPVTGKARVGTAAKPKVSAQPPVAAPAQTPDSAAARSAGNDSWESF